LKARCNTSFDCEDGSDENYCELVVIDVKSYRKINPPDSILKTDIIIDMEIYSIKNIDEMSMTFEAELRITLKWKDPRLTFKDLKETGNYMEKSLLDQIWLPKLYFANTKGNLQVLEDDSMTAQVLKEGNGVLMESMNLHEGNLYEGKENSLMVKVNHQFDFDCSFELSNFPFDNQACGILIGSPVEIRNLTRLKPGSLTYTGKKF
jgi:hypothetical protein